MTTLRTKKFSEFFREASNNVLPQQECSEKKERYDTCFINWYSEKYLRGSTEPSRECEELFKEYKGCLNKALKEKGIYGMIEGARKASPDNDNAKEKGGR